MATDARATATCPDCQSLISLPPMPEMWMRITCPECGTQLEIVDDSPWELDYTEDVGEVEDLHDVDYEDYEDYEKNDLYDEDQAETRNR